MQIQIYSKAEIVRIVREEVLRIHKADFRFMLQLSPIKKPSPPLVGTEELVGNLNLSVRCSNSLFNANMQTIEDLRNTTPQDLLRIRNFGKRSLLEIETQMTRLGYELGENKKSVIEKQLC